MSSPSSSNSTKRKRTTVSDRLKPSTNDMLQPSSRDASGEELAESPAANTRHRKHVQSSSIDNPVPPSKRARTRSNAASTTAPTTAAAANGAEADADPMADEDPGEPSSTTEDSQDIEEKSQRRQTAKSYGNGEDEVAEGDKPMKSMGKAGMRDPIGGYKTNPPPTGRAVRIYADGVFDLFHLGHMRQLEQAKNAFPEVYLMVGVTGDEETHRRKGLTVLTGAERAETVRHCKWVDEVLPNCPWIVTKEFLAKHNIDYVAHDDEPYGASEGDDIYAPIKKEGKFLVTERTEGVSTTGIITKIVKDYEKYIARQLKRGTSRQELNVSWLKKNELDIKRHVAELRDSIKTNWSTAGGEIGRDLRQFWQNASSRPASPAPFGRNVSEGESGLRSPSAVSIVEHLKHLEVPGSSSTQRADSPGRFSRSEDFAAGYSLGLIGGVKSWMMRGRGSLRDKDSQAPSPEVSEDDDTKSPVSSPVAEMMKTPMLLKTPPTASSSVGRGRKERVLLWLRRSRLVLMMIWMSRSRRVNMVPCRAVWKSLLNRGAGISVYSFLNHYFLL